MNSLVNKSSIPEEHIIVNDIGPWSLDAVLDDSTSSSIAAIFALARKRLSRYYHNYEYM